MSALGTTRTWWSVAEIAETREQYLLRSYPDFEAAVEDVQRNLAELTVGELVEAVGNCCTLVIRVATSPRVYEKPAVSCWSWRWRRPFEAEIVSPHARPHAVESAVVAA